MEQIDKYRAQELAYGHAGFVGSPQADNVVFVAREHHLMHPVQRLYGGSRPVQIRYEVDGQSVTASAALAAGDTSRQELRYQSGLTLRVNWRAEPWRVEGRVLPQWGFLAVGPQTRVTTALFDGHVADYAECPEYIFADARTYSEAVGLRRRKDIEPRLAKFEDLGGGHVRVTYEWIVNDRLNTDYHCFVHGLDPHSDRPDDIVFQQDHSLPRPTGQWRPGMRLTDGPYEFSVPATLDRYDLAIGLYRRQRVPLKGCDDKDRVILTQLKLERSGGKVTAVTVQPPGRRTATSEAGDFAAHLNASGTWIDFGTVATDGALKINREKDRLVLFAYPRGKQFGVSLDIKALAPGADSSRVKVRALAAGDARDLGPVAFRWEQSRLAIEMGSAGAGRYVVEWRCFPACVAGRVARASRSGPSDTSPTR
jgi:hypothetical protein